jgi:hypothetical protein
VVARIALQRINKLLENFLGLSAIAGIVGLIYYYRDVLLTHKRWSAIVLLSGLCLFLGYLTTAIRRFHADAVRRVGFLALVRGQGTQLFSDVSGNTPLRYYDLEGWRGSLAKAFYEAYGGYKKALPLQEGWPPITLEMDINEQRLWIDNRLRELDDLIARECEASGIKRPSL